MSKIDKPGIYDIPMDEYHSDNCVGPSISSSGLRTIINECAAEYWAFSYLNPDAFQKPDTKTFAFGRAAHCLLLGGEAWDGSYIVRPTELADDKKKDTDPDPEPKAWQGNRVVCRRWLAEQEEAGLTVVTPDQLADIQYMAGVLEKHPLTPTLLEGQLEKSIIWQDHETSIWLKSRPDVIPKFDRLVNDYKSTTNRCAIYQLTADIFKYGYHMQAALVEEGLEAVDGRTDLDFALTFQQSVAPYHVMPIQISPEAIAIGRQQNRKAIRTLADCLDKGEWPGYAEGIPVAHPPEWLQKKVEMTVAAE